MIFYVYKITLQVDGRIYVGQRRCQSLPDSEYMGSGLLITRAIEKYGKQLFKKEILEICEDEDHLNKREVFWIKELNSTFPRGFNILPGGLVRDMMTNHPEKERICKQISVTLREYFVNHPEAREITRQTGLRGKGKKKPAFSEEHKRNIRIARAKQGATNKGKKFSRKWRRNLSLAHLGKPSGRKGKKMPDWWIKKMKEVVTCPYCGKTGGSSAMKVWHFNNCKLKPTK